MISDWKKRIAALLLLLILTSGPERGLADILRLGRPSGGRDGIRAFETAHPSWQVELVSGPYEPWPETEKRMRRGLYARDAVQLTTLEAAPLTLGEQGLCADLSGSPLLMAQVQKMHPVLQSCLMKEGRLYAIPQRLLFHACRISGAGFEKAGLPLEAGPASFPELLSFLNVWCDRLEKEGFSGVRVAAVRDETTLSSNCYTQWLVRLLMDQARIQLEYAGQPLRFSSPAMEALLERAFQVGQRLDALEPWPDALQGSGPVLFECDPYGGFTAAWPGPEDRLLFLPLWEGQPPVLPAALRYIGVYGHSEAQAPCTALLECLLLNLPKDWAAFFYRQPAQAPKSFQEALPFLFFQSPSPLDEAPHQARLWGLEKDFAAGALSPSAFLSATDAALEAILSKP